MTGWIVSGRLKALHRKKSITHVHHISRTLKTRFYLFKCSSEGWIASYILYMCIGGSSIYPQVPEQQASSVLVPNAMQYSLALPQWLARRQKCTLGVCSLLPQLNSRFDKQYTIFRHAENFHKMFFSKKYFCEGKQSIFWNILVHAIRWNGVFKIK